MRVIELAEWFLEHVPVDQPGQPDQRVAQADASRLMQPSTPNTVASTRPDPFAVDDVNQAYRRVRRRRYEAGDLATVVKGRWRRR
jgi:hypothetical protein